MQLLGRDAFALHSRAASRKEGPAMWRTKALATPRSTSIGLLRISES